MWPRAHGGFSVPQPSPVGLCEPVWMGGSLRGQSCIDSIQPSVTKEGPLYDSAPSPPRGGGFTPGLEPRQLLEHSSCFPRILAPSDRCQQSRAEVVFPLSPSRPQEPSLTPISSLWTNFVIWVSLALPIELLSVPHHDWHKPENRGDT